MLNTKANNLLLQVCRSVAFPVQGNPPVKFLALLCVPWPHAVEQLFQGPHAAHAPSTENIKS